MIVVFFVGIASCKYYRGAIPLIPKGIIFMNLKLNFGTGKKMTEKRQLADLINLQKNAYYDQLDDDLQYYYDWLMAKFVYGIEVA